MDSFEKNILALPKQLDPRAVKTANLGKLKKSKPDGIVVCGMGGSGIVGDILRDTAAEIGLPAPVVVFKNDGLLPVPFKRPLYVCVSFSGDTGETLHSLQEAARTKAKAGVAVVTARGGEMRRVAEKKRLPAAFFSPGHLTPRQASGSMYYGLTNILRGVFPRITVRDLSQKIKTAGLARQGAALAKHIKGKNILIYSDEAHLSLGYFWKITLNETGKNAAFVNFYPEIDHNEIEGFSNIRGPWSAIWLVEPRVAKVTKRKVDFIIRALERSGIESVKVALKGKTVAERIWNGIALAEWSGYNLAKLNGAKPAETKAIDELKKRFE